VKRRRGLELGKMIWNKERKGVRGMWVLKGRKLGKTPREGGREGRKEGRKEGRRRFALRYSRSVSE
jgi:hypothetical protein